MATPKKKTVKKKAPAKKALATIEKSVPVVQSQSDHAMNALVSQIESGNLQPEQLSMVLDAQERILDRQAKMDYMADMASCQSEIGNVLKSEFNAQTKSYYEDLESLNRVLKPVYTKWGFAVSFGSMKTLEDKEGWISMEATVMHRGGYSVEHFIELPMDSAGIKGNINKTPVHAIASSRSYARRYLLREIFNITTTEDADDDGNAAYATVIELITEDQVLDIESLISEIGADRDAFLRVCKVESFDQLPASKYHGAIGKLEAKREQS